MLIGKTVVFGVLLRSLLLQGGCGSDLARVWIHEVPTKVTVRALRGRKLGLQLSDLLPEFRTLASSTRLLGSLGLKSRKVLLDMDEVEDNVEDSGEDEREEQCGAGEVHWDQLDTLRSCI